jgi:hypothetical protein
MNYSNPRPTALTLIESGHLSVEDLWHQYRAMGGKADALELDAYIHDIPLLHGLEVEILRVTLTQLLPVRSKAGNSKRGGRRFTYPIAIALERVLGLQITSRRTSGRPTSPLHP